jgi:excisionase family DNA binding protein
VRDQRATHETYTPADIAARYRVTLATVAAWIHSGELRAVNVGRKVNTKKPRWRITADALAAFEAARAAMAPAVTRSRRKRPDDVIRFYE